MVLPQRHPTKKFIKPHLALLKLLLGNITITSSSLGNSKSENDGVKVFAIEQVENAVFLQDFEIDKTEKYALVFGNEVLASIKMPFQPATEP